MEGGGVGVKYIYIEYVEIIFKNHLNKLAKMLKLVVKHHQVVEI